MIYAYQLPTTPTMAPIVLLDLPTELLVQIPSYLRYPDHLALFVTCQTLYSILPRPKTRPSQPNGAIYRPFDKTHLQYSPNILMYDMYDMFDLLRIERWPCYTPSRHNQLPGRGDFFACSYCLKIRPALFFATDMMKWWRRKVIHVSEFPPYQGSTPMDIALKAGRFCIPCGIGGGKYRGGKQINFGGREWGVGYVCTGCLVFFSKTWGEVEKPGCWCNACYANGGRRDRVPEDKWGIVQARPCRR